MRAENTVMFLLDGTEINPPELDKLEALAVIVSMQGATKETQERLLAADAKYIWACAKSFYQSKLGGKRDESESN